MKVETKGTKRWRRKSCIVELRSKILTLENPQINLVLCSLIRIFAAETKTTRMMAKEDIVRRWLEIAAEPNN